MALVDEWPLMAGSTSSLSTAMVNLIDCPCKSKLSMKAQSSDMALWTHNGHSVHITKLIRSRQLDSGIATLIKNAQRPLLSGLLNAMLQFVVRRAVLYPLKVAAKVVQDHGIEACRAAGCSI